MTDPSLHPHGEAPTWPALIVKLAEENGLSCRCIPGYTGRGLIDPDCTYHDFCGFVDDLLAAPVDKRMEAMGMVVYGSLRERNGGV